MINRLADNKSNFSKILIMHNDWLKVIGKGPVTVKTKKKSVIK